MLVVRLPAIRRTEAPLAFHERASGFVGFAAVVALAAGQVCPFGADAFTCDLDGWAVRFILDGWIYHASILKCV